MFDIDKNIAKAETMPREFYTSTDVFEHTKGLFSKSWQFLSNTEGHKGFPFVSPEFILPGFLNEPVLITKESDGMPKCVSNVCTHRANLLVNEATKCHEIRCKYHGRRFTLDGKFKSMPSFDGVENFPCDRDNLTELKVELFAGLMFTSIKPAPSFKAVFGAMINRMSFLPLEEMTFDQERSKDFEVRAHWSLYCDNYLEGFHIPFVHPGLNTELSFGDYEYELFEQSNLQIGIGKDTDHVFDIPKGHQDYGKKVAAYYWWVYPNMMFNFYPWGLSFNIVDPVKLDLTKVSFKSYVLDASKLEGGAGAELLEVEKEDEDIVEQAQKGIQSSFYHRGRYSASMEKCVHHFHRLMAKGLNNL